MNTRSLRKTIPVITLLALCVAAAAAEAPAKGPVERTVFYFHRTARCPTCLQMESWAREVVKAAGDGEKSTAAVFKSLNLDLPENQHYARDFEITFTTVVAAEVGEDGRTVRWKNMDKIWEYAHKEADFRKYLEDELGRFFDATP